MRHGDMVGTAAIAVLLLGQAAARPVEANPELHDFQLENVDYALAFRQLARVSGARFEIRPGLKGTVTVKFSRAYLSMAVRHMSVQLGAGYEVQDGKYVVFHAEQNPSGKTIPWLECEKVSALDALKEVFRHHPGAKWEVEGQFKDGVNLKIEEEVPFEFALRRVLEQIRGDYQVSKGVYYVQVGPVMKFR